MTPVDVAAVLAVVVLSLYAVLGGADFGGGVWDMLATGERRNAQRAAVTHAIGPVWEANHVWLIFAIVLFFACFPGAFADVFVGLYFPLTFALAGVVLRGAAFVFRNFAEDAVRTAGAWTAVFGAASIIAPFFFGASIGAVATGRYAWTSPFALGIGIFAVAVCAQLAAVFMTVETVDDAQLQNDFRARALSATLTVAIVGAAVLGMSAVSEPKFFAGIVSPRGLSGVAVAMVLGAVLFVLVFVRRFSAARIAVAAEAVAILCGWFGAQAPYLVPGRLRYVDAAAPESALVAFLWTAAIGAVFLIPSLGLLFVVFKRRAA